MKVLQVQACFTFNYLKVEMREERSAWKGNNDERILIAQLQLMMAKAKYSLLKYFPNL